jgi:hypothetical protein
MDADKSQGETESPRCLKRGQAWVVAHRMLIVYLGGSYAFWLVSAPFIYKAVAECNGIERLGYQCGFLFSPITVPLMLIGYTVVSPALVILGHGSVRELAIELAVAWILAVVAYGVTFLAVRLLIKAIGGLLKKSPDPTRQ